jgi:glutamine synthetase type III
MEENNPKGQYKVKHKTHTIPDRIPGEHDNTTHMLYRMGEYIPTVQDKITPRTHKIAEHYLDGHDNLKHIAQWIGGRILN